MFPRCVWTNLEITVKPCTPKAELTYISICCDPIILPILYIHCLLPGLLGEHHRLFGPLSQPRALVNKLNLCNLADGYEPQSPGRPAKVAFPNVLGPVETVITAERVNSPPTVAPACFAIWMMKLIYGPLVCAEQPQSFCQVMNSINTMGY